MLCFSYLFVPLVLVPHFNLFVIKNKMCVLYTVGHLQC